MRKRKLIKRTGDGIVGLIAVSFVVALVTFFVLLHVEKEALKEYEKAFVYMASGEVPEDVLCDEESFSQYFTLKEVSKDILPVGYVDEASQAQGKRLAVAVSEGTILTEALLTGTEDYTKDLQNPVLVGVKAEDLSQVASGILRGGDMVHVYTVTEEGASLLWENVLVQESFDGAGSRIASEDKQSSASRVNLLMEKSAVEDFYTLLAGGELKVVKVW